MATDTRHPAVHDDLEEWREFVDRIDVLEVLVEDFLDKLVPTNESYVPGAYERFPEYFPIIDEPIRHHDLVRKLVAACREPQSLTIDTLRSPSYLC